MNIYYKTHSSEGKITLIDNKEEIGYITYLIDNHIMTINHTIVHKQYGGKGYARQLVDAAIELARRSQWKIVPQCSYVAAVFKKRDDINDVTL